MPGTVLTAREARAGGAVLQWHRPARVPTRPAVRNRERGRGPAQAGDTIFRLLARKSEDRVRKMEFRLGQQGLYRSSRGRSLAQLVLHSA